MRLQAGWLPVLYFVVMFGISVRGQYKSYFRLDPFFNQKIFGQDPFSGGIGGGRLHQIALFRAGYDRPVFGSEPEICFYSQRRCVSSYLYTYPLMEKQKFAQQMKVT